MQQLHLAIRNYSHYKTSNLIERKTLEIKFIRLPFIRKKKGKKKERKRKKRRKNVDTVFFSNSLLIDSLVTNFSHEAEQLYYTLHDKSTKFIDIFGKSLCKKRKKNNHINSPIL